MVKAKVPQKLYHGSSHKINGSLKPILIKDRPGYIHKQAAVFATERADIAALFMFPDKLIGSIGFEKDVTFICIWGTAEEFEAKPLKGYLYVLPGESFEKVGKVYEWQSFSEVTPMEVKEFHSVIDGMMELGIQVYFINDDPLMDKIVENKYNRTPILKELVSENQKRNINIRNFNLQAKG